MIAVRSWERAKGLTRIEFVAGVRALADYRRANKSAREIAALFSTGRDDAPALATHMIEENKDLHRRVRGLEEVAAKVEAQELFNEAKPNSDGTRVISKMLNGRDPEALKKLAQALIANPQTIALLASRDQDAARLVFARSTDAPGDMNQLMRKACELLDGRGGGKPELAQGGGKNVAKLDEALRTILNELTL
jgi:alanyl-tRNA synthetase